MDPDAVVEVAPLIGAELDLDRVGEARDESMLGRRPGGTSLSHRGFGTPLIAVRTSGGLHLIFRSALHNGGKKKVPFLCKLFGSAGFGWG